MVFPQLSPNNKKHFPEKTTSDPRRAEGPTKGLSLTNSDLGSERSERLGLGLSTRRQTQAPSDQAEPGISPPWGVGGVFASGARRVLGRTAIVT